MKDSLNFEDDLQWNRITLPLLYANMCVRHCMFVTNKRIVSTSMSMVRDENVMKSSHYFYAT